MDEKTQTMSLLASMFAMQFMLDPYGDFRDIDGVLDRGIEYDPLSEDCKFYMNLELIRLMNLGYTEDEMLEMIDSMNVEGMDKLNDEQLSYVRNESKKLVMERKERLSYE